MNGLKEREYLEAIRNPGKFNAMTFEKEYGEVLK